MCKKYYLFFAFIGLVVLACFGLRSVQAGASDNVSGFAWSENIGWISFNSTSNGSGVDYGVSVDLATGNFSGYAWSENIGWISFEESNPPDGYGFNSNCPDICDDSNNCTACYDSGDGNVYGWAKILSLGDDGWLKLGDSGGGGSAFPFSFPIPFPLIFGGSSYRVSIDAVTGDFSGWAWNGNDNGSGIGWVSFNCADAGAGGCAGHDYKVISNVNTPPEAINLSAPNWNYDQACSLYARQAFLRWEFDDPDPESEQSAYQVIIDNDSDPADPIINTGKIISIANQYSIGSSQLAYNTPYYWWVKVWDNHDVASDWAQYDIEPDTDNDDGAKYTFTTYLHEFPDVDFNWLPENPSKGEEAQFTDSSEVYLSAAPGTPVLCDESKCDWQWTFDDVTIIEGTTASSSLIVKFNSAGGQAVTLKVTDNNGYYCGATKQINVNVTLPKWKEVK